MISDKILNEIYKIQVQSEYLTTKQLNENGLTQYDLTTLIESSKLKRIKRGYYQLTLDNPEVCLTLLSICIKNKNYNKAFEYIDKITELNDESYNKDNDFILYLLSMITTIPDKYNEYTRYLRLQDIRIDFSNKRYADTDIQLQNDIRKLALNKKFVKALKEFTLLQDNETENTQNIIIKELLSQAKEYQIHSKQIISKYAKEKEYQKLAEYLSKEKEKYKLNRSEEHILNLALEILDIKRTNTIPKVQIENTEYLYEAIDGKNYNLALSLYIKFLESKNVLELDDNPLYVILYDINEYIKKITQTEQLKNQTQEAQIIHENEASENNNQSKIETTFVNVIDALLKKDIDTCLKNLDQYLEKINKKEYTFLLINLIKLSAIQQDVSFIEPLTILTQISSNAYEYKMSEYIEKFYEAYTQEKIEEAIIYLDILKNSYKLGQVFELADELEQLLNENVLNVEEYQENQEECIDSKMPESIPTQEITEKEIMPAIENIPEKKETTIIKSSIKVPSADIELIKQKLPTLKKHGIILLKPMTNEQRQEIHNAVHKTPNVVSFNIGKYEPKQIVLRYIQEKSEYINFTEEVDKVNKLYKSKNYPECISHCKKLLKIGKPPAIIYAKLGLAYMKMNVKDKAIDYLTVATELNKEIGDRHDFSDLIAHLQGLIPEGDKKPKVNIKSSEFKTDLDNYYGIKNIEEIAQLISNGMPIESICQTMGLECEYEGIIALIFARECYFQCRFDLGDKYLKIAERSKHKSKLVLNLLEEVRKNKKFYAHRIEEGANHKILILTPNPRKN